MKILHYLHGLPPVRNGGLVQYTLDLAQGEYELGNDVQLLVPGRLSSRRKGRAEITSGRWGNLPCHYIINPLPVTEGRKIGYMEFLMKRGNGDVFFAFLKKHSPDIIHMHSFMGIECTFLEAAKKLEIPVIFTTHDYYGLCPQVNLFNHGTNCEQSDWQRCALCMGPVVPDKKIVWQHSNIFRILKGNRLFHWLEYSPKILPYKIFVRNMLSKYKNAAGIGRRKGQDKQEASDCQPELYENLRDYYLRMYQDITLFHFNSSQSRRIFESRLENIRGEIIPITNRRIKDNRRIKKFSGMLKIGYLGSGQQLKGYRYLKENLDVVYKSGMTEFECHVYFNAPDLTCPYLRRHVPYKEGEMERVFRNMDVLVVPSLWRETFGMVVLEAFSYGVPVIMSSYVGAKELLDENPGMGIVIDIKQDNNGLRKALEEIYKDRNVLSQMNEKICGWDYEWDYDKHIEKMINVYRRLICEMREKNWI